MKLSVIVSNYNRAWFLDRSLFLLGNQLYPSADWELIVIDDGSADSTQRVVEHHRQLGKIQNFRFIKRTHEKPKGGSGVLARNVALKVSHGDIVLFSDPEVFPMPDWIHWHMECHQKICRDRLDFTLEGSGWISATETGDASNAWRHAMGMAFRVNFQYPEPFGGLFGNVYNDYDWFNIQETWARLTDTISKHQSKHSISEDQIRNTFYAHIGTQGGWSMTKSLILAAGGHEEELGRINSWGGDDTLLSHCFSHMGAMLCSESRARAVHLQHGFDACGMAGPTLASQLVESRSYFKANENREWGVMPPHFEEV